MEKPFHQSTTTTRPVGLGYRLVGAAVGEAAYWRGVILRMALVVKEVAVAVPGPWEGGPGWPWWWWRTSAVVLTYSSVAVVTIVIITSRNRNPTKLFGAPLVPTEEIIPII